MSSKVKCSCGHSWNTSDSSKKDMKVCHICGKDNTMKDGGWLEKYNDGGPVQENYNDSSASASPDFVGDGYSNVGRNYSPAWGGQFAMGGSMPGAVGFTYARTGSIPSNGKYAKKTKASAQNGMEMQYYQEGLDFKPKSISRDGGWLSKYEEGGVIQDDMGQYNHPGEITEIGSNQITMQGVPYPVLGISDTGDTQMMYPDQEYQYDGNSVTEYPMAQDGDNIAYADNTRVGTVPRYTRPSNYQGNQPDTLGENIFEIVDPSGVSSWDDIYRSYNKTGMSDQTRIEAFGAIPMLGKLKKIGKIIDLVGKTIPKSGRQARNLKASVNTIKAVGKYGPTAGRATDAIQAYTQRNEYEQGGQLTKLDQLTNFTNYNTKQPGSWLSKYE